MPNKTFLLILMFILTGCSLKIPDTENFTVPQNSDFPLKGLYKVVKAVNSETGEISEETGEEYAAFHKDLIVISNEVAENPKLRLRKVELSKYLMRNFSKSPEFLNLYDVKSTVFTVYGENRMPYELLMIDDSTLIFYRNKSFLFLDKKKDIVSEDEARKIISLKSEPKIPHYPLKSGILFGIKIPTDTEFLYETYFFSFEDKVLKTAFRDKNLFVPTGRRFLRIVPENKGSNDLTKLTFKAEPIYSETTLKKEFEENEIGKILVPTSDEITFVGHDYLSIERTNLSNSSKSLRTVSVHTPDTDVPMSLYDLFGSNTKKLLHTKDLSEPLGDSKEENFAIERIGGKWALVIRTTGDKEFTDYVSDVKLPEKICRYDDDLFSPELVLSHVPDAIDSFSSPNADIIFVQSATNIKAYPVENNQLLDTSLMQWNLPEGASIIMVNWQRGSRVEETFKIFGQSGAKEIKGARE